MVDNPRRRELTQTPPAIALLRTIGSPLPCEAQSYVPEESPELFDLAFRNRVGLLYLNALRKRDQLGLLQRHWEELTDRELDTSRTASRASDLLIANHLPFFVFMTFYPFPATPNDVEIIVLGTAQNYERALATLRQAGYRTLNQGPDTCLFGDPRGGQSIDKSKKGGRYYVDVGRSVSLDFFQFLDLRKATRQIVNYRDRFGNNFPSLDEPLELAASITHSVLEQRLGLEVVYFLYYFLADSDESRIRSFASVVEQHHMKLAVAPFISIASQLHADAFGIVPDQLRALEATIGTRPREALRLRNSGYQMQHRFAIMTFALALLGKLGEPAARASMARQLFHMANPIFFADVMRSLWVRRTDAETRRQR